MALDTLANVKSRLGITTSADDTLLGLLQDSADQAVANFCSRDFVGGTFTEYHPGGSEFVHLRNFPVDGVTSVKVDVVFDPPWTKDRMSEAAKLQLGIDD